MQRPICHQPEHRDDMRRQRNLHHSSRLRLERNETIPSVRRGLQCCLITALLVTLNSAVAQGLPFRFGEYVVPGTRVEIPEAVSVQGDEIKVDEPTVVIFTMVEDCFYCSGVLPVAQTWHDRYTSLQVILVDTRNPHSTVREWADDTTVPLIHDENAFEDAFDTNRTPIIYLVDREGIVQDKVVGLQFHRILAFDEQLARANRDDWDAVADNSGRAVQKGLQSVPLEGMAFGSSGQVVVYISNPYCISCLSVPDGEFQQLFSDFASSHPDTDFYFYEPKLNSELGFTLTFPADTFDRYADAYGLEALPPLIQRFISTGIAPPDDPIVTLPDVGWPENVKLVRFESGSRADPATTWGYPFYPALLVFDQDGVFLGPTPYWSGNDPYSLVMTVDQLLKEGTDQR